MQPASWERRFRVRSYECDPSGLLPLGTLCRYFQEAASEHAERMGFGHGDFAARGCLWALHRMRVESLRRPGLGEQITVHTWRGGRSGVGWLRAFRVTDGEDRVVARASSSWIVVDAATRRVRRDDPGLGDLPPSMESVSAPPRVRPAGHLVGERAIEVFPSDLDMNGHVNSARYLDWAIDAVATVVPPRIRCELESDPVGPPSVAMEYAAELGVGDRAVAVATLEPDGGIGCAIRVAPTGRNTFLARVEGVGIPGFVPPVGSWDDGEVRESP